MDLKLQSVILNIAMYILGGDSGTVSRGRDRRV